MTPQSPCPKCHHQTGESIKQLFTSDDGEYFTCLECHYVWLLRSSDRRVVDAFTAPRPQPSPRRIAS